MNAVDTNVLFYAHDPRDSRKQTIAVSLIQTIENGVLLWQVACEYLAASRKLEPHGYLRQDAWQDILDLKSVWATAMPSWQTLDQSQRLMERYSLSHWDSMILAACADAGVSRIYTAQQSRNQRKK